MKVSQCVLNVNIVFDFFGVFDRTALYKPGVEKIPCVYIFRLFVGMFGMLIGSLLQRNLFM